MDKTRELLRLTKEGNEAAREQIILNNVGLIWSVVRRFTNRDMSLRICFRSEVLDL